MSLTDPGNVRHPFEGHRDGRCAWTYETRGAGMPAPLALRCGRSIGDELHQALVEATVNDACARQTMAGEIVGDACPDCGHTNLVHPSTSNPAVEACVICSLQSRPNPWAATNGHTWTWVGECLTCGVAETDNPSPCRSDDE